MNFHSNTFFLDFKLIIKDGIGHNLFSLYNTLVLPHIILLTVEAIFCFFVSTWQSWKDQAQTKIQPGLKI